MPPILNPDDVRRYRNRIMRERPIDGWFTPMMTFQITAQSTPELVRSLKQAGVEIGKLYPANVTTNSEDGVSDFEALYPVFAQMQSEGMFLSLHGEMPGVDMLDAERAFLPVLKKIARRFPQLMIILEHVSTAEGVKMVKALRNVAGTITPHHLWLTWRDVFEDDGKTVRNPHLFCKPVANRPEDREALIKAATSRNGKFFLGSDSAPHLPEDKVLPNPRPGVFNAPVAIQVVAQVFENAGRLRRLQEFTSENAETFYNWPTRSPHWMVRRTIELVREPWRVPDDYHGIVPFLASETLQLQIAGK